MTPRKTHIKYLRQIELNHLTNTRSTQHSEMCLEELENDHGLEQIYRQMMPVDLFQAQYGGWLSNLPWHIKSLMGFGILVLLAVISCGIYFAYLNCQGTGAEKIKRQRKKQDPKTPRPKRSKRLPAKLLEYELN